MATKKKKPKSIEEEILENRKNTKIKKEDNNIEVVKPNIIKRKKFNKKFENLKIKYKKDPKKYIVLATSILLALSLLVGTSYAYLTYISKTENEVTIEAGTLSLTFENETNSITLENALPQQDEEALEQNEEYSFTIKNNGSLAASYKITLDNTCTLDKTYTINGASITPDKCTPDSHIKVGIKEENGDYEVLEKTNDNEYILAVGTLSSDETKSYTMKIWLDYDTPNEYNSQGTLNIIYSGKLGLEYEQRAGNLDITGANKPILANNMIAVYYDETAETWKKADANNNIEKYKWYDYNEKIWANSVTVTEGTRATYQNAEPGTEIPMDDILTMQVWIPRYKYKVWNYNSDGKQTSTPQTIDIVFEKKKQTTGEIECTDTISGTAGAKSETCKINNQTCTDDLCNDKYYTHPAFTFGSEELEGIWIGKFELTGNIENITTKPNLSSLRSQNVSAFQANIIGMNVANNRYGFSASTDTHMIKNIEWGAVAYLSHSRYGINKQIGINSYGEYLTGCGSEAGSLITGKCNPYNTKTGMQASTTGNIYGIYDMSGGAFEYTMSNIISNNGTTMMSGNSSTQNSEYTGILYNDGSYSTYQSSVNYPEGKYIDKYSFGISGSDRQRSKLGDGIKEVYNNSTDGWYKDYSAIANNTNSWFLRGGGYCLDNDCAGIFNSDAYYGSNHESISSRFVIIT